jgi:hypothetical protein
MNELTGRYRCHKADLHIPFGLNLPNLRAWTTFVDAWVSKCFEIVSLSPFILTPGPRAPRGRVPRRGSGALPGHQRRGVRQ